MRSCFLYCVLTSGLAFGDKGEVYISCSGLSPYMFFFFYWPFQIPVAVFIQILFVSNVFCFVNLCSLFHLLFVLREDCAFGLWYFSGNRCVLRLVFLLQLIFIYLFCFSMTCCFVMSFYVFNPYS